VRYTLAGALAIGLLATGLAGGRPSAQSPPVVAQLDRYLRGDFEAIAAELAAVTDFGDVLDGLKRQGTAWVASAPAERQRRRLAAATFALEAARAAEQADWKWVQRVDLNMGPGTNMGLKPSFQAADALWWKAPPLLIEWACALVREEATPAPIERIWHLAALAVAQRRADYEFLIGSPWDARGNPNDEIDHLKHAMARFPDEPRFALAQAIAVEWRTWPTAAKRTRASVRNLPEAMRAFEGQLEDSAIGAEATLRLGYLRLRGRNPGGALKLFDRVQEVTRDRFLLYLAHYFSGQALERQNRVPDAERAYRRALDTIPHAISATMTLAAVLTRTDRRLEASALVEASLAARPQPVDPWRAYGAADDRFWPELIARLHAEIRR
jgi:tetratricopeptide (TPR) repeat protein